MMEEEGNVLKPHQEIAALSLEEKRFLLAVERGDVASSRRWFTFGEIQIISFFVFEHNSQISLFLFALIEAH